MRFHTVAMSVLGMSGLLAGAGCEQADSEKAAPPPPPAVTVAQPVVREVQDFNEYTGRLAAVEQVEVRARVRGYLDSVGFKDGDDVKKDQLLFQIDPRPFDTAVASAQGQIDQLKARRARADADVKRYQGVAHTGAVTQQDVDKAVAELAVIDAGMSSAQADLERAKLDQVYARITSPIDGRASRAFLTEGNLVGASEQPLTTIVRLDPIYVYFDVDQRAAQQYQAAAIKRRAPGTEPKTTRELNIKFQFGLASEDGFPHEGVVDFIDNTVDPDTGTVSVRGEAPNPDRHLKPGYFARVRVPMGDKYQAILVADRAIGTQQGEKYVISINEKGTAEFLPVKLGAAQDDGLRVVRSGLKADQRIVVNGLQRARPGATVKPETSPMPVNDTGPTAPAASQPVAAGR